MTAPDGMTFGGFETIAGHAISDEVVYTSEIAEYNLDPNVILQPLFEAIWEDCGLEYPYARKA